MLVAGLAHRAPRVLFSLRNFEFVLAKTEVK
jgi:hypothetical protein